jgi:uncharacterized protein
MRVMPIAPNPQFVVKVSKYCNLRCDYCYEFPHLGDRARMKLDELRALFTNIKNSVETLGIEEAEFVWHGGEPFLIPIEFYREVGAIQRQVFGDVLPFSNIVQTNLTILTDRHVEFLRSGEFFSSLGVSFDVYGAHRLDIAGKDRTELILSNIQTLIDNEIRFGALTVLARDTLPWIRQIYRFFDGIRVDHRLLVYFRSFDAAQDRRHGLTLNEVIEAYNGVFDEWLASDTATRVVPIEDFVNFATRRITGAAPSHHSRGDAEGVFVVDMNGDVYDAIEPYEADFCYGNLFRSNLEEVVGSEQRQRSAAASDERVKAYCGGCPHYGACPGFYVANAGKEERAFLQSGCPVRGAMDHIIEVFHRTDIEALLARIGTDDVRPVSQLPV